MGTIVAVLFGITFVWGEPTPLSGEKGFAVGGLVLGTTIAAPIEVRYEYDSDPHGAHAIPPAVLDGRQALVDGFDGIRLRLADGYGAAYAALIILFCLHVEDLGLGLLLLLFGQLFQLGARIEAERESLRTEPELTV